MNIEEIANLYVACGKAIGFFYTEMILMKHLPEIKPDGSCSDVPAKNRPAFIRDLQNAAKYGVKSINGELVILENKSAE